MIIGKQLCAGMYHTTNVDYFPIKQALFYFIPYIQIFCQEVTAKLFFLVLSNLHVLYNIFQSFSNFFCITDLSNQVSLTAGVCVLLPAD